MSRSQPLEAPPLRSAAEATTAFVRGLPPAGLARIEAQVAGREAMPLLCVVEAALATALPRQVAQELVWLGGAPPSGAHTLRLQAFGAGGKVLAEASHEFGAPS